MDSASRHDFFIYEIPILAFSDFAIPALLPYLPNQCMHRQKEFPSDHLGHFERKLRERVDDVDRWYSYLVHQN